MAIEASDSLMVNLSGDTLSKLDELARHTKRTSSALAGEVISDYVSHELEIVVGIQRGLSDRASGRITSHDQAMERVKLTIERAKSDQ
jgi:predicted transcriptional regulator